MAFEGEKPHGWHSDTTDEDKVVGDFHPWYRCAIRGTANRYHCICAFVLPCYVPKLKKLLTGGVPDLETIVQMLGLGVTRFGVGLAAAVKILDECAAQGGIEV